jgi:hypothetical protein
MLKPTPLSPAAAELRARVLASGDARQAADYANDSVDVILSALNLAEQPFATSILTRVMIVRALQEVACCWLGDVMKVPRPVGYEAFRDLVNNPPAHWRTTMTGVGLPEE